MKNIFLALCITAFLSINSFSQNVGIGTTTPSHSLHIVPQTTVSDPLRVEGLNMFTTETFILTTDTSNGVVKHMPLDSLVTLLPNDTDTDVDSMNYVGDTLYVYENGTVAKTEIISTDTDVDSMNYIGDTLYLYENGKTIKTEILASGGVATLAGYDTLEYATGRVWIDGRPVYGRVIHDYTGGMPSINLSAYFPSNYLSLILDLRIHMNCSGTANNSTAFSHIETWEYNNASNSFSGLGNSGISSCGQPFTIILEYVKQ